MVSDPRHIELRIIDTTSTLWVTDIRARELAEELHPDFSITILDTEYTIISIYYLAPGLARLTLLPRFDIKQDQ